MLAPYKRALLMTAVLTVILVACGWYFDAMLIGMLCVFALMVQLIRLLYNLLRWNRGGLAAAGIRFALWSVALISALSAHDYYGRITRADGDGLVAALQTYRAREGRYPPTLEALVPRDIAAIPTVALLPSREQKFRYRLFENHFHLMYVSGFRLASQYDSQTGKWEEID